MCKVLRSIFSFFFFFSWNLRNVSFNFSLNGELLSSVACDTHPPRYLRVTSEIARKSNAGNFIGWLIKREGKKELHSRVTSRGVNTSAAADTPLIRRHAFPHYQSLSGASIPFSHPPATYSRARFSASPAATLLALNAGGRMRGR